MEPPPEVSYITAVDIIKGGEEAVEVLFISIEEHVTSCHYDEQQNLFAQLQGYIFSRII